MEPGVQAVAGLALLVFPGLAWAWALGGRLGWAKGAALGLVLALTLVPFLLYLGNILFGLPLRLGVMAFAAASTGMAGVAVALAPRALARLGS